jgi:cold shock CspA family protein
MKEIVHGEIVIYNWRQGFGWISLPLTSPFRERLHGADKVFFHISKWKGEAAPVEGAAVSYRLTEPQHAGQNPQAADVTPIPAGLNMLAGNAPAESSNAEAK